MSTSRLQKFVSDIVFSYLGEYNPVENCRPDWLITPEGERLELDFLIESLHIAIEVQGAQHYTYIEFYHKTPSGFLDRLRRDRFKREICERAGITLYEISSIDEAEEWFNDIQFSMTQNEQLETRPSNPGYELRLQKQIEKLCDERNGKINVLAECELAIENYLNWESFGRAKCQEKIACMQDELKGAKHPKHIESLTVGIQKRLQKIEKLNVAEARSECLAAIESQRQGMIRGIALMDNKLMLAAKSLRSCA